MFYRKFRKTKTSVVTVVMNIKQKKIKEDFWFN